VLAVLTPEESARLDAASPEPVEVLMERAGMAVALAAAEMGAGYSTRVTVLVGPGNNGGDGYVAARHLARRGAHVEIRPLAPPKSAGCRWAASTARLWRVPVVDLDDPVRADLVVDAVFGGGFRGQPPASLERWFDLDVPVLAVDVPTGLDPATGLVEGRSFDADVTVTFHTLFPGHLLGEGPDRCGRVQVADIGLPPGFPYLLVAEESDCPRPARARIAHKWSAGSVLVVGGSPGMVGAAVMAARSALSFGAGAVGLATPDRRLAQELAPEVLAYELDDLPDRYRVVVVGPGLAAGNDDLVKRVLGSGALVVADAGAFDTLDPGVLASVEAPLVLTPHAGEFGRLARAEAGPEEARAFAAATGTVLLLKGNPTFVTDGATPVVVTSGGPELASIGTGDVLAGMVAALLARGVAPAPAAWSAAYWHGVAAADLAGSGAVTAHRLVDHVGRFAWGDG
jgi:hydroxyethylthiazole kinase-like uncharacterized protein yjeF